MDRDSGISDILDADDDTEVPAWQIVTLESAEQQQQKPPPAARKWLFARFRRVHDEPTSRAPLGTLSWHQKSASSNFDDDSLELRQSGSTGLYASGMHPLSAVPGMASEAPYFMQGLG